MRTSQDEPREPERRNRLATEKSPYLLQHAANPVDWYPWGEEAFERARREDKPVFLSIGYSTCHWCHVMEQESFEDPEVAELLNDAFVSIKVDREERPDVDAQYMTVCQMLTGGGGWPLTVALTPERKPFFAGTYFPKDSRGGRIGMLDLVPRLRRAWEERRGDVAESADRIVEALRRAAAVERPGELGEGTLEDAHRLLESRYDDLQGGFGSAPKFPTPHNFLFLLRWWRRTGEERALEMVTESLRAMRRGGIFDQVGFGFHRYSTDARWLLPHFEKMLYDQALHALAYTEAYLVTGDEELARTAREVLDYVLRDLRDPAGGFHTAEDADSEGREGAFYVWGAEELTEVLGPKDAELARRVYNVEERGNFAEEATGRRTGENVLHLRKPLSLLAADLGSSEPELRERLESIRGRLFEARERRPRPLKDDKVLTDWNGLAIGALAFAARSLGEVRYAEAAREAAGFLLRDLRDGEGRLLHRFREGESAIPATADDHAFLAFGLTELYQADFDPRWLEEARRLVEELHERFWDEEAGGYFLSSRDAVDLPVRQKEVYDGAVPSANSVAYGTLLRLARLTADTELEGRAARLEAAFAGDISRAPAAHAMFLTGLDFRLGPVREVVLAGDPTSPGTQAMLEALRRRFLPRTVTLLKSTDPGAPDLSRVAPFTRGHAPVNGRPAAYVCEEFACRRPVTEVEEMLAALET